MFQDSLDADEILHYLSNFNTTSDDKKKELRQKYSNYAGNQSTLPGHKAGAELCLKIDTYFSEKDRETQRLKERKEDRNLKLILFALTFISGVIIGALAMIPDWKGMFKEEKVMKSNQPDDNLPKDSKPQLKPVP
jgi:hypothetical protein